MWKKEKDKKAPGNRLEDLKENTNTSVISDVQGKDTNMNKLQM